MNSASPVRLRFGPFVLDVGDERLDLEGRKLDLTPKAFSVLCLLATRAGRLVTKDELLDEVWGRRFVSESVLKTAINTLRDTLGDDARRPRYIETAARRGYRFIAEVEGLPSSPGMAAPASAAPASPGLVGRTHSTAALHASLARAGAGQRQLLLVGGEAGVGKSTLIDHFVRHSAQPGGWRVAHGQCIEHYGGGEPYLPLLEALNALCRDDGEAVLPLLRQAAPTWLVQLPWFVTQDDRQRLQREVAGATQARMLREFGELAVRLAATQPLLLVIEDLHWSDAATLLALDYLARRRDAARLLVVGSFRPADVIAGDHPLKSLRQELRLHELCGELDLDAFSERELADYLGERFGGAVFDPSFVRALHAHTDGLPLFVAAVVDELVAERLIVRDARGWRAGAEANALAGRVPARIAGVIEKQWTRLAEPLRGWIEVASVAGTEFAHVPLADALQVDADVLQAAFDELAAQQAWLCPLGVQRLPDGRLAARYAFRHALMRNVLYARCGTAKRAQWHLRVAQALQQAHAGRCETIAAELGMHFERGLDVARAVQQSCIVARRAMQRFAPREAASASAHGLHLLAQLPAGAERDAAELELRVIEGVAAVQLRGLGDATVTAAFDRAWALCDLHGASTARVPMLHGLWWGLVARGEFARALRTVERVIEAAGADPVLRFAGDAAKGITLVHLGRLAEASGHLSAAVEALDAVEAALPPGLFVQDPGVQLGCYLALALWLQARPVEALQRADAALAEADRLAHPMSQMGALYFRALLHNLAGEHANALHCAARALEIIGAQRLERGAGPQWWAHGRARAALGEIDEGLAEMRRGRDTQLASGLRYGLSWWYLGYGEACLAADRLDETRMAIDEGLAFARDTGEALLLPALLRLDGDERCRRGDQAAARRAYEAALAVSREQGSVGFEHLARQALAQCPLNTR